MMQNNQVKKSKYHQVDPQSLYFKLFLIYDIFMVFLIIFNLFCLCANFFIMSNIGGWFFHAIHLESVLSFYREHLHRIMCFLFIKAHTRASSEMILCDHA